jgi:transposase
MERYIGLDVHASSCTAAIIDGLGKHVRHQVLETNGTSLVEFFKLQPGRVHLCLEEVTQSSWLVELLLPHVSELVVTLPKKKNRGQKSDLKDAFDLAEQHRRGALDVKVYKHQGPFGELRQLVKTHAIVVTDCRRVQSRLKALYRSRGVPTPGEDVYKVSARDKWLDLLPKKSRSSAELLYFNYDATKALRNRSKKEMIRESHRFPITKKLETCPGMGPIRVARLVSVVINPHRFRGRRQFWSYCGLAVVMHSSSDWDQMPDGSWQKVKKQMMRGLNLNFNRMLKDVFKGAASTVIQQGGEVPLYLDYLLQTHGGTKPNLAKLTLARKIASISLSMWKNEEEYDPNKRAKKSS